MNGDDGTPAGGPWTGAGLPPVAAARTAEARSSGTWSSALSTGEFAAIRSVGFEPVGQVMGSAVYRVARTATYWGYYDCGYPRGVFRSTGPARVAVSGQGAASAELVRVLLRDAPRRDRLYAFPSVENAASNALCRASGFEEVEVQDLPYRGTVLRTRVWALDLGRLRRGETV